MIGYPDAMGKGLRRLTQAYDDLGTGDGQGLSGADIKRYPLPAPRIDLELERSEGLDLRVRSDARLLSVAAKLPRNRFFSSMGGIDFSTLTFSSRSDSLSDRAGGSIARLAST